MVDDEESPTVHSPRTDKKSQHHGNSSSNSGRRGGGGGRNGRGGGGRGGAGNQSRQVQISKALSRLLRHAAVEEKIPIDEHGYVRCDHLLEWKRLKSFQPKTTLDEVVEEVRSSDKQRFGLMFVGGESVGVGADRGGGDAPGRNGDASNDVNGNETAEKEQGKAKAHASNDDEVLPTKNNEKENDQRSLTKTALSIYDQHTKNNYPHDPKLYYIRATQGHSMNLVTTENLLTPITLADIENSSVPETVVHGTFYGAWESILKDGHLKRMGRNHVHFATGPPLRDVVPDGDGPVGGDRGGDGGGSDQVTTVEKMLERNKVISGMRRDAQVLIYVDLRKALSSSTSTSTTMSSRPQPIETQPGTYSPQDISTKDDSEDNAEVEKEGESHAQAEAETETAGEEKVLRFYRSENNVILTPGLGSAGIVPSEYWDVVAEVKEGLGVLWRTGEGVVKELPERLKGKAVPFGKDGRRGGRGRGGSRGGGRGEGGGGRGTG